MKKWITGIGVILGMLLFPKTAMADSPITSTDFYHAYEDIAIVKEAAKKGVVDQKIAEFLADSSNPIDIKAAVINALSWGQDYKHNAELYIEYIYDSTFERLDPDMLSGDQLFCIGYMREMDYYYETNPSAGYLQKAKEKLPGSFTVAMITALAEGMTRMNENLWDLSIQPILNNKDLTREMRPEAITIITDYMQLYNAEWAESFFPKTGETGYSLPGKGLGLIWGACALLMAAGLMLTRKNTNVTLKKS